MSYVTKCNYGVTFLTDISNEEIQKVHAFVNRANEIIDNYFGIKTSFDVLICSGSWEMEVQVISRIQQSPFSQYSDTKFVGVTDYRLEEIIIRYDIAKFGHYLHELIHGVISKTHTQQLREGLAWYFTLKLTEPYRYVRPNYPSWVDHLYVYPTKKLARIVGDDFMKDFALGKASVKEDVLPVDIQELFLPAELFYAKSRYGRKE